MNGARLASQALVSSHPAFDHGELLFSSGPGPSGPIPRREFPGNEGKHEKFSRTPSGVDSRESDRGSRWLLNSLKHVRIFKRLCDVWASPVTYHVLLITLTAVTWKVALAESGSGQPHAESVRPVVSLVTRHQWQIVEKQNTDGSIYPWLMIDANRPRRVSR